MITSESKEIRTRNHRILKDASNLFHLIRPIITGIRVVRMLI
jgi:hypothetical protein